MKVIPGIDEDLFVNGRQAGSPSLMPRLIIALS
jgi:hypothetical protein